jgi:hypothetical protein
VLRLVGQRGNGRLFVCSAEFVEALSQAHVELLALADEDDSRADKGLSSFAARLGEIDQAWLAATDWPTSFVSTQNRLAPRLGLASEAERSSQTLWCWYGPAVPQFDVVSGAGPYPSKRP